MNPDELTPPHLKHDKNGRGAAANMVRSKIAALYSKEPDAKEEAREVAALDPHAHLSKHQKYMKQLTESGKDPAEVQTAWHEYYQALKETEKHEVWQEFYAERQHQKTTAQAQTTAKPEAEQSTIQSANTRAIAASRRGHQRSHGGKKKLRDNHHVRSLMFGLSMGGAVVFILLFSFFNERFLVPFIRPSANVSATPIIVDPNNTGPVGPESKIIIPKINIEAPVIYDVPTIEESDVQAGLERGVVHYPTTPNPGERGNAVIFGHSSGNILNKGKFKFAFILLKSLEEDDTFIVQYDSKRYVYKIYSKYVTSPTDFSVLDQPSDRSIMTLITCDPPGTSTNRLIIQAEQIFPDPAANAASSVDPTTIAAPSELPSNSPSLWQRITSWF